MNMHSLFLIRYVKKILFICAFLCIFSYTHAADNIINLQSSPIASVKVGEKLYVISKEEGIVSVVNTTTNLVEKTIAMGPKPISATVVGKKIYVNNSESTFISIIDTTTDTVKTTVSAGAGPISSILVGANLYVNNFDNSIGVVNTVTDILTKTIPLTSITGGTVGASMVFLGNRLYLHHTTNNSISVIDTTKNIVIKNFITGEAPLSSIRIDKFLYTVNSKSKDVTMIDVNTFQTYFPNGLASIAVGNNPSSIVLVSGKLYVNNIDSASISVIDKTKNVVIQEIPVGKQPAFIIAEAPYLYIFNAGDDSVSIIDARSDKVVKTLPVGDEPISATVVGKIIYVNNKAGKSLSRINITPPILLSFFSETPDDTYSEGSKIQIGVLFDQNLGTNSIMTVVLNNGKEVNLTAVNDMTLIGEYTVETGQNSTDLTIKSIKSAKIIGMFGPDGTAYTIPTGKNLGDLKNIIIKTSNTPISPTSPTVCKESGMYRLCPLSKTPENSAEYRENMLCEGFIKEDQSKKKRISRIEVLGIAVNMFRGIKTPAAEYTNAYTDITAEGNSQETVSVVQTGLDNGLIFANNGAFEPTKNISRIEAYALLMRGVCMKPDDSQDAARAIHQKALQNGITTKSWARFRANSAITRNEVFIVASQLADWADKNGGCDKLECRK